MKTNSGFDFLVPVYDPLARFVFGKSMVDSQAWFLDRVPLGSKVLILGGGTGWLLDELQKCNSSCTVWYVEISSGMMKRARLRRAKNLIHFIKGTEESIPIDLKFDVVITNFYLDLFSNETLIQVVSKINTHATSSSVWLVTDFAHGAWWHSWLLKIMYLFFRSVCGIEARQLPSWPKKLHDQGWEEISAKFWYGKFIKSVVLNRA